MILDRYSIASRLVGTAAVLALLGAGGWTCYSAGKRTERIACAERAGHAAAQASEAARKRELEMHRAREIVETNYRAEVERARRSAGAARTELDRLRGTLAARDRAGADSAATPGGDGAAAERDVLGACAAELVGMAAEADAIAARLRGAQQYITETVRAE